jgi:hypothetical protein
VNRKSSRADWVSRFQKLKNYAPSFWVMILIPTSRSTKKMCSLSSVFSLPVFFLPTRFYKSVFLDLNWAACLYANSFQVKIKENIGINSQYKQLKEVPARNDKIF